MRPARCSRVLFLALGLAWAGALGPGQAFAAPPLGKLAAPLAHDEERGEPAAQRVPPRRLDLTVPVAPVYDRPAASGPASFPVPARRGFGGASEATRTEAATDSGLFPARALSRPETLARNFQREGLPVARLFQSDTALVHLGLSPKGKPGLWIVEKLH